MIYAISYGTEKYAKCMEFNGKRLLRLGADRFRGYTPQDLDPAYAKKYEKRLSEKRGAGLWFWKPHIIMDALNQVEEGDYVLYTDAAVAFLKPLKHLTAAMDREQTNIMVFTLDRIWKERSYSKRDALILMDADKPEYLDCGQYIGTYLMVKKAPGVVEFLEEWQTWMEDDRIATDIPNQLGVENYPEFVDNRHDQTVLSLMCKKKNMPVFRDPSEYGLDKNGFDEDVLARSTYPQMVESFRNPEVCHWYQLKYRKWYALIDPQRSPIINRGKRIPYYITHLGFVFGKIKKK